MSGSERLNGAHRAEPRAKATPKELTPEALATGLYAKRGELRALARRHGMTLDELARRTSEPETSRSIVSLRRLAEARAGVLLARARADATTLLLSLARSAESDETRRRACVDLLKAPSAPNTPEERADAEDAALDDGAATSVLSMLERLGEASRVRAGGEE
jgi:hypothetical protein